MTTYTCTLDVDGWQLYGSAEAAAKEMSEALTAKVAEAKARLKAEPLLSEDKLAVEVRDAMHKIMDKHIDDGAQDTEPQCVLVSELEEAFGLESYSLERW